MCNEFERVMTRAFLMAHLFTGSSEQAERATLEALDLWNPDVETEEVLLHRVVDGAASQVISNRPNLGGAYLPDELRAVLKLAPQQRRCFVLRILVGLPAQVCARLLRLHPRRVDQLTSAAVEFLVAAEYAEYSDVEPLEAKLIA
jgi:DNA-directed RNA polymerase specialized sigma24 family protein